VKRTNLTRQFKTDGSCQAEGSGVSRKVVITKGLKVALFSSPFASVHSVWVTDAELLHWSYYVESQELRRPVLEQGQNSAVCERRN
jgi:hypothetical protein